MKMKSITITLLAVGIFGLAIVTPGHAALPGLAIYAHTDKSSYTPGDTGTLFLTVRNEGTNAFTIKNVTVTYPWKSFITDHWDGNFTSVITAQALAQGQTYNNQYSFAVPTDGRASNLIGTTILISVGTSEPSPGGGTFTLGSTRIQYTGATYQPVGLASSALPIIEIVLLGATVAMLALVFMGIRKLSKK